MAIAGGRKTNSQAPGSLAERYARVGERIATAAERSGRRGQDIVLVAVGKFASMDEIRELIRLGHVDFGENRVQQLIQRASQVQEFLQRHRELGGRRSELPEEVRWHMIGHLQRNKVRKVIEVARLIHSVDSLRLVEEIQAAAARRDQVVEVLIQVNVAREKSKHGVVAPATRHLIDQIDTMLNIRPRGLMCMAPYVDDPEEVRPIFQQTRELFDDIRRQGVGGDRFNILSMGMSSDFEVAIECGANVVRVGSAIFGEHQAATEPESDDEHD